MSTQLSRHLIRSFKSHKFLSSSTAQGLAYDSFVPNSSNAAGVVSSKTMVMTHGILGSKRNWRTPANLVSKMVPGIRVMTVDHRGHGQSHRLDGENTVAACARDLEMTIESDPNTGEDVDILCGHSFGGKVVLELLNNRLESGVPLPEHTWVLDSLPSEYDDTGVSENTAESVVSIFGNLRSIKTPFPSTDYAVNELMKTGISLPIAQWLTSNVRPFAEGANEKELTWGFDLDVATELFEDFVRLDMWDFVRNFDGRGKARGGKDAQLHFVRAGRNPLWTDQMLEQFDDITTKNPSVKLHTMANVGHWLHVEDVKGLVGLLTSKSA